VHGIVIALDTKWMYNFLLHHTLHVFEYINESYTVFVVILVMH